jgi:hypothetical protein
MDFAKAFDKVNHSLLIHKLRYYGIDGKTTRWIQNWLADRQHTDGSLPQSFLFYLLLLGHCIYLDGISYTIPFSIGRAY